MMKIDPGVENEGVAKGKSRHIARELFAFRHRGVIDQDRNNGNAAFESRLYFKPDEVSAVVKAAHPVARFAPMRSDNDDESFGLLERRRDVFAEIDSVRDRIEIHKDAGLPKLALQPVVQTSRDRRRIFAAIGNGDHLTKAITARFRSAANLKRER